jgi:cell surface protein SprA
LNIEPIKHFKIELTANRSNSRNNQSFFRYDEAIEDWVHESPSENGNFSATVMSWPTTFLNDDDNFSSEIWTSLLVNRLEISSRLNDINYNLDDPNPTGYYQGWGPTSQDVTIPAFMSAYLGLNPSDVSLDVTKVPVAPNWRVSYDGLSKIPSLKKKFRRFNLSHTYRSTMSTSYTTNLSYTEDGAGLPTATDNGTYSNYISQRQFNTVSITEQLSPLIGLDMTLKTASKNEPQIKVELTRDRNVSFGLANYQITETKSKGIVVGVGYKFVNVRNPFMRTYGKLPIKLLKETDLLLRCDVNIRDNSTIIRKIEELQNQVTAGQTLVSIKFSADLEVSDKVTLRAFYDQQLTSPKISTSFATSNINSGFAIRFNLNQ